MVTATFNILGVWTVNIMVLLVILVMVGSKFKTKSIDVFFNQNINKYDAKVLKNKQNENEVTHEEESGTESESGAGAGTESEIGSGTGTESEAESDKKVSRKFVPPSVEIEPDTGNPPPRSTLTPPPPKQSKTKSKQTKFSYDDTNIGQAPRSSSFFNPNFSIMDEPLHHQEDIELQLEPSQQQKQSTIPPKQSSKPEIVSGWLEVQQSPKLPPKQHEIVSGQAEIGSGQGPPEPPKQPPELPKQSEIESGQGSSEPPKQLEIEPPKQSEMVSAQSQPQTELKENENKNENENEMNVYTSLKFLNIESYRCSWEFVMNIIKRIKFTQLFHLNIFADYQVNSIICIEKDIIQLLKSSTKGISIFINNANSNNSIMANIISSISNMNHDPMHFLCNNLDIYISLQYECVLTDTDIEHLDQCSLWAMNLWPNNRIQSLPIHTTKFTISFTIKFSNHYEPEEILCCIEQHIVELYKNCKKCQVAWDDGNNGHTFVQYSCDVVLVY